MAAARFHRRQGWGLAFRRTIPDMTSPRHKRCLGCGYILDGLPEPRCPECGRAFDVDDPKTYFSKLSCGRQYLMAAIGGAAAMAIAVFLLPPGSWFILPLMFAGLLSEAVVVVDAIRLLRGPRGVVQHRNAMVAALVTAMLPVLAWVGGVLTTWVSLS